MITRSLSQYSAETASAEHSLRVLTEALLTEGTAKSKILSRSPILANLGAFRTDPCAQSLQICNNSALDVGQGAPSDSHGSGEQ